MRNNRTELVWCNRAYARALDITPATVIAEQRELGIKLLTRHVDGVRVTSEATQILSTAEQMEQAAFGLLRARDQAAPLLAGEVRIAITEGLGTFWLTPRLIEFQRAYPHLQINLNCTMRAADDSLDVNLPDKNAVYGVRGGFEWRTPIGPIRVEYGVNNLQRKQLVFRLGTWAQ